MSLEKILRPSSDSGKSVLDPAEISGCRGELRSTCHGDSWSPAGERSVPHGGLKVTSSGALSGDPEQKAGS